MTVELEIPSGTGGPQQMLIDSGSSEIAFCNKALAEGLTPATYPQGVTPGEHEQEAMGKHGTGIACGDGLCDGKALIGAGSYGDGSEWWWGYNYFGDLYFDSQGSQGTLDSQRALENITFAVMQNQKGMTCDYGFDGIWGVAFLKDGATAYVHTDPSMDPALVLCVREATEVGDLCENKSSSADGVFAGPASFDTALGQALEEAGTQLFGIYLDVNGTDWAEIQNGTTKNMGSVYIGFAAKENNHYKAGDPNVVPTTKAIDKHSQLSESMWTLPLLALRVKSSGPEAVFTVGKELNCGTDCYVDTGNPNMEIPGCAGDAVAAAFRSDASAMLELVLTGPTSEEQVVLDFPVRDFFGNDGSPAWWASLNSSACVTGPGNQTTTVILGLPTFFYYYLVFDYGTPDTTEDGATVHGVQKNTSITFVKTF
jgi:hypothetical protein